MHDTHAIQPAPMMHLGFPPDMVGGIRSGTAAAAAAAPVHSYLQHQSKSFPPRLQRTPSVSSQSSLESAPSRVSVGNAELYQYLRAIAEEKTPLFRLPPYLGPPRLLAADPRLRPGRPLGHANT